jgi:hypothetical protein
MGLLLGKLAKASKRKRTAIPNNFAKACVFEECVQGGYSRVQALRGEID